MYYSITGYIHDVATGSFDYFVNYNVSKKITASIESNTSKSLPTAAAILIILFNVIKQFPHTL